MPVQEVGEVGSCVVIFQAFHTAEQVEVKTRASCRPQCAKLAELNDRSQTVDRQNNTTSAPVSETQKTQEWTVHPRGPAQRKKGVTIELWSEVPCTFAL